MNIEQVLRHPVETFRTAPFGLAVAFGGLCITSGLVSNDIAHDTFDAVNKAGYAVAVAEIGAGALAARKQFRLRAREEKFIEKYGFDNRYFVNTTTEWCDRQTTRVVCAKYGVLDKYVALCDESKQNDYLTYIPHV